MRHQPAVGEPADAADGVAAHAVAAGSRPSAVARVAVGGEPFLDREGVAAAVQHRQAGRRRRGRPRPGRRRRPARRAAASPPPTGLRRPPAPPRSSAAACAAGTAATAPAVAEQQRPGAEGRACGRPRPAGCATHSATAIIQSMPSPISCQNTASKPNGMREHAENAHRHHPGRDDRHGEQIGEHAIGREPMEVEGGIRRGREAGDQRGQDEPGDLAPAPQRDARAERACRRWRATAGRADRRRSARASPQTTSGSSDARPPPAPAAARRRRRP